MIDESVDPPQVLYPNTDPGMNTDYYMFPPSMVSYGIGDQGGNANSYYSTQSSNYYIPSPSHY